MIASPAAWVAACAASPLVGGWIHWDGGMPPGYGVFPPEKVADPVPELVALPAAMIEAQRLTTIGNKPLVVVTAERDAQELAGAAASLVAGAESDAERIRAGSADAERPNGQNGAARRRWQEPGPEKHALFSGFASSHRSHEVGPRPTSDIADESSSPHSPIET